MLRRPRWLQLHPLTLGLACLAALAMLFISEASAWRAQRNLAQMADIAQARSDIQQLDASLRLAALGALGTRDDVPARREIAERLLSLQAHYVHDPAGAALLQPLQQQVLRRLDDLARRTAADDAALVPPALPSQTEPLDAVRQASAALMRHEWAKLGVAQAAINDVLLVGRWGVATLSAICLLALALYLRQASLLQRQQLALQTLARADHDRLEQEVARRTAELTELHLHLLSAREDERARLARDLHDELGALLTAAKLDTARLRARLGTAAPEAQERLAQLVITLNRCIALKRRIIEDLRPSTLSNLGLVPTLEILAREFAERSGLALACDFGPVPLDSDAELVVFRLVQEATTNIAKHAQARHVSLTLRAEPEAAPGTPGPPGPGVRLRVADDGVGFDTAAALRSVHGLAGMRFRVVAEGGQMQVQSQPGAGTVIEVWLPASRGAAGGAPRAASA